MPKFLLILILFANLVLADNLFYVAPPGPYISNDVHVKTIIRDDFIKKIPNNATDNYPNIDGIDSKIKRFDETLLLAPKVFEKKAVNTDLKQKQSTYNNKSQYKNFWDNGTDLNEVKKPRRVILSSEDDLYPPL